MDRIRRAEALPETADSTDAAEVDRFLSASFGIFSGNASAWAVLRFSPEASRWVSDEA